MNPYELLKISLFFIVLIVMIKPLALIWRFIRGSGPSCWSSVRFFRKAAGECAGIELETDTLK
jgi:hypothetical protein